MFIVLYLTGFFLEKKPCTICSLVRNAFKIKKNPRRRHWLVHTYRRDRTGVKRNLYFHFIENGAYLYGLSSQNPMLNFGFLFPQIKAFIVKLQPGASRSTLDVSQVLQPYQSIPNHTKPYQTHNYEVIWIFWKNPIWGQFFSFFWSTLKITSLQYFQILMSHVWYLMSNVKSPMSSWSWRSWQFLVYWSLTLKQLHLVVKYCT